PVPASYRQAPVLTSPARSRPKELLQSASAAFRAWHRLPALMTAFRALSRPRETLASPLLTRALATAPVPASYCQAPVMACSARPRPTARLVLTECRSPRG